MDSSLYNAASQGQVDDLRQHIGQLEIQTTGNRNTALHVAAQFGQLQCVAAILDACPSLLRTVNIRGETPLHMAAREGYDDIVKALIECAKNREQLLESGLGGEAKKMLRVMNVDKDTALHMAARNCHFQKGQYLEVIRLLTEEDCEFEYAANINKETPLYLAAEQGTVEAVVILLKTCTSLTCEGPSGTALHAAAFSGELVHALLEWKPDLIKEQDAYGWTPLHSAARHESVEAVKKLLEKDKSLAYVAANGDEGKTALHIATALAATDIMEEILSNCPDCWEVVNAKGQNILHIAAHYKVEYATVYIFKKPWVTYLIDQKDHKGNTPLHVLASERRDLYERYRYDRGGEADLCAFNHENWTPTEIYYGEVNRDTWPGNTYRCRNGRDKVRKDRERIIRWEMSIEPARRERVKRSQEDEKQIDRRFEEMFKTHMIVATLLATISFTASFTIPGGYRQEDPDEGMAVLVRHAAFKAFVVTNTIAVICSTSSVFLYLSASLFQFGYAGKSKVQKRNLMALTLVIIALVAMTIAFITGSYAVFGHSLGLAIPICVIGCSPLLVYGWELTKFVRKMLRLGTYKNDREWFHGLICL